MKCESCEGTGIMKEYQRGEHKEGQLVVYNVWELCNCERGRKLKKLWKKFPQWKGAPYGYFIKEIEE